MLYTGVIRQVIGLMPKGVFLMITVIVLFVLWIALAAILVAGLLICSSKERQRWRSLLNEHDECQGCYMLKDRSICTNPECRHYVQYSPTSEVTTNRFVEFSKRATEPEIAYLNCARCGDVWLVSKRIPLPLNKEGHYICPFCNF